MLNRIIFPMLAVIAGLLFSCGGHKESQEHHADGSKDWKEMDSFHMVMAEAFHPYKDSADLRPAKKVASELAAAARDWKNSAVPEGIDADKMQNNLDKLVKDSEEFAQQVATENDETLGRKLTDLHDLFHEMQNDYYGAATGHEHGDDHDGDHDEHEGHEH
jgi:hypothetical protein